MTAPPGRWLRIAAALAGLWGAFMLVASIALAIPLAAEGASVFPVIVPIGLSLASGVGAWGLRGARSPYQYVALGACASWVAFLFMVPLKLVGPVGIGLNVLVAGIVATSWSRFR